MAETPEIQIVRLQVQLEAMERSQKERHEDNKALLEQILVQARTTNGRIGALETWKAGIEQLAVERKRVLDEAVSDIKSLKSTNDQGLGKQTVVMSMLAALGALAGGIIHWLLQKRWP